MQKIVLYVYLMPMRIHVLIDDVFVNHVRWNKTKEKEKKILNFFYNFWKKEKLFLDKHTLLQIGQW